MRPAILALALACALATGCTSPAALPLATSGRAAADAADPVLRSVLRDVALAHGVMVGDAQTDYHAWVDPGSTQLVLETSPHAGYLVVELVQRVGQGAVLLHATPPSAADRTPVLVDSSTFYAEQDEHGRARLAITDPEPGKWVFDLHADGVVLGFEGTLYATSLSAVAEAFSAVPIADR